MKTLYVRIKPKTGAEGFFRCGMKFTKAWQKLDDVDNATAKRLAEEQMLEVQDVKPAELESDAPNEADPSGATSAATSSGTSAAASGTGATAAPEDPAERLTAIRAAVAQLDLADAALWTSGGKPKTDAIAAITGWPVTAAERDALTVDETKGGD